MTNKEKYLLVKIAQEPLPEAGQPGSHWENPNMQLSNENEWSEYTTPQRVGYSPNVVRGGRPPADPRDWQFPEGMGHNTPDAGQYAQAEADLFGANHPGMSTPPGTGSMMAAPPDSENYYKKLFMKPEDDLSEEDLIKMRGSGPEVTEGTIYPPDGHASGFQPQPLETDVVPRYTGRSLPGVEGANLPQVHLGEGEKWDKIMAGAQADAKGTRVNKAGDRVPDNTAYTGKDPSSGAADSVDAKNQKPQVVDK
jgi:hypothetical protein